MVDDGNRSSVDGIGGRRGSGVVRGGPLETATTGQVVAVVDASGAEAVVTAGAVTGTTRGGTAEAGDAGFETTLGSRRSEDVFASTGPSKGYSWLMR